MSKHVHLNFNWQYIADIGSNFELTDDLFVDAIPVDIPHTCKEIPLNNFDERAYQFKSAYRKYIDPAAIKDFKHAMLKFHGVLNTCKVYLNRALIAEGYCGYLPLEIDIKPHMKTGIMNEIIVVVDSSEDPDVPPFGHVVDFLTYGGIYREVELILLDDVFIENCQILTPDVTEDINPVDIQLHIANPAGLKDVAKIHIALCDPDGMNIKHHGSEVILTGDAETQIVSIHLQIEKAKLWQLLQPNLYTLKVSLTADDYADFKTCRFGFRCVEFKSDGFYLNGKNEKLIGLNRHQSFPYVGYAMPRSAQQRDAEIVKYELGCNCVRSSHYPPSQHFLDRCDEIGLLVFNEIPGWQHIGSDPVWRARVLDNVAGMIRRDWNHPSVFIWGVRINESEDCSALYQATNQLAKELDSSRATGGVRCIEKSELLEDVYTFNDFSHTGQNNPLLPRNKVVGSAAPYLVSEHTGHMFPTKAYDSQDRLLEHALRHARVLNHMYGDKDISGALGWCMADYNTHEDFGSGDGICYHGVLDIFREPKYAASVYASQQKNIPVMAFASNMKNGDYAGAQFGAVHVFTNCDYIKLYKNKQYIQTFYPDKAHYPALPHAPIIIDDFIGPLFALNEPFSQQDAEYFRSLFSIVTRGGIEAIPVLQKLKMLWVLKKNRLTITDAVALFTKYIGNWGDATATYHIEGYQKDRCVMSKASGKSRQSSLMLCADNNQLTQDTTYDVTRVVVRCQDEDGALQLYANTPLQITVNSTITLIGPDCIALIGGRAAFWVKTNGKSGVGIISIDSPQYKHQQIQLQVCS
ncbi:MAG: beta-galactosidase [Moritella sp.]|jgi:beta-galactosidase